MPTITKKWYVDDVLTDPTSIVLSDPGGAYGVKRNDNDATVVADGTALTKKSVGVYEYTWADPAYDLTYTYWIEIVDSGETFQTEHTIDGAPAPSGSTWVSTSECDDYMSDRLNTSAWDNATSGDKSASLAMAQRDIENSSELTGLPGTATQLMKDATCEQALYLLNHIVAADKRSAVHAGGVKQAAIAGETYVSDPAAVGICGRALDLLSGYQQKFTFHSDVVEIVRDEDDV